MKGGLTYQFHYGATVDNEHVVRSRIQEKVILKICFMMWLLNSLTEPPEKPRLKIYKSHLCLEVCVEVTVFRLRRKIEYWHVDLVKCLMSLAWSLKEPSITLGSMRPSIKVIFWTNGPFGMKEKGRDGEGRKENEG